MRQSFTSSVEGKAETMVLKLEVIQWVEDVEVFGCCCLLVRQ
jgi:hypothetical protein